MGQTHPCVVDRAEPRGDHGACEKQKQSQAAENLRRRLVTPPHGDPGEDDEGEPDRKGELSSFALRQSSSNSSLQSPTSSHAGCSDFSSRYEPSAR